MAHISTRRLTHMCDRVGTSLNAGVDILKTLDLESSQTNSAYREAMQSVARQVGNGATLAEAMRSCDGYFPPLVCELVDVGEQTGRLESVMAELADHYRHLIRLRQVFLAGLIWPLIELFMAIGILGGLILILGLISPSSSGVFGLAGPRGLAIYAAIVLGTMALLALIVQGLRRGWFGPWPLAVVMRIPVVGQNIKTMALARLSWTLSLALNAGIDAQRAMRMALDSTSNSFYTQHQATAEAVIGRGGQFHEALQQTGVFSHDFLSALENAEVTGTASESLMRLSKEYQERAQASSKALAVVASIAIWVSIMALLAFVIINLVMSLYIRPMYDALEMIDQS